MSQDNQPPYMDGRYPHTYADDYIRGIAGYNQDGTKLSRSDAAHIIEAICEVAGQSTEEVYRALADRELAKTDEEIEKQAHDGLPAMLGDR